MVQAAFEEAQDTLNDDPDYRPMSGLAVAGVLLGACSVAAFFAPLLWSVPVMAIALNLAALRHIRSTAPPRAGKAAALTGLALSVFCLIGAISYDVCYNWLLQRQAARVAELYLAALLNDEPMRQISRTNWSMADGLEELKDTEAVQRVLELEDHEIVLDRVSTPDLRSTEQRIACAFRVRGKKKVAPGEDQEAPTDSFLLAFEMARPKTLAHRLAAWRLRSPFIVLDPESKDPQ